MGKDEKTDSKFDRYQKNESQFKSGEPIVREEQEPQSLGHFQVTVLQ